MRRRKSRNTSFIAVLVGVITLMVLVSGFFIISWLGENDEQPGTGPGSISGSTPDPASTSGSESGNGSSSATSGAANGSQPVQTQEPAVTSDPVSTPTPRPSNRIEIINIADRSSDSQAAQSLSDLYEALNAESSSHNSMGVSLVAYDGFTGQFYTYSYGYADRGADRRINTDTKIRIASLSKFVVAICAIKLVDEGKLDLDEDISTYLGYRVRNPDYPNNPITARMLMQHSSSIHDSTAFTESLMGRDRKTTQDLLSRGSSYFARPGSTHLYSNFGYTVLGAVVEHASGVKLDAYASRVLFEPLGIDAAFQAINLDDSDNLAALYDAGHGVSRSVSAQIASNRSGALGQDQHLAQGSLLISALDYAKILAMLGNGGVFLGERILSPEAVSEIHKADFPGPVENPGQPWYLQGLSTRLSDHDALAAAIPETTSTPAPAPGLPDGFNILRFLGDNEGVYWHTGSAYGVFAQYIYISGSGTDEGIGGIDTSRGVVVITTGARTARAQNGMIDVCTHLSEIAWHGLGFEG